MIPEFTVINFKESLAFYTKILGFQVSYTRDSPSFAYLLLEKNELMIEEYHNEDWNIELLNQPLGRGVNFQIEITDVDIVYANIIQLNIPIYSEIKDISYKTNLELIKQREFLVQDPDGYLLRFCQKII